MSHHRALSVVLGLWQDRAPEENLDVARCADELGFAELWIGEMTTYDAFALATAVGGHTERIAISVGPLAVHVRTPLTVATGVASVAHLTGREVNVALGTSSDIVVERWHGRDRQHPATTLEQHAIATRELLSGRRVDLDLDIITTSGARLRLPAPAAKLSIAAFGSRAIGVAARHADRLLLNMVTPQTAGKLRDQLLDAARATGRPPPRIAVWLATAVEPSEATVRQITTGKVGYLAAPGYGDMFADAGFEDLVAFARTRPHPRDLAAAIPFELLQLVGLIGSLDDVRRRIEEYHEAGVDEVCVVPATAGDEGGRRTLHALATLTT